MHDLDKLVNVVFSGLLPLVVADEGETVCTHRERLSEEGLWGLPMPQDFPPAPPTEREIQRRRVAGSRGQRPRAVAQVFAV
ncbi:hypothetical protein [Microtetraspora fusca]|uniref:hypothetical protein n=1 Tax=Microtetraspora fusca TaxID=1997 RepID=UPI0012FBB774|nr:hypothetical protein [Microtetraspora fusca]